MQAVLTQRRFGLEAPVLRREVFFFLGGCCDEKSSPGGWWWLLPTPGPFMAGKYLLGYKIERVIDWCILGVTCHWRV